MSKLTERLILVFAGIFKGFLILLAAGFVVGFAITAYVAVLFLLPSD